MKIAKLNFRPEKSTGSKRFVARNIKSFLYQREGLRYTGPVTSIEIEYLPAWMVGSGNYGWFIRRYDKNGVEIGKAAHEMTKAEAIKTAHWNCSARKPVCGGGLQYAIDMRNW
jgi:hypothetical protein